MRAREQQGYVWREGDWWLLRYRDSLVIDGKMVRKQVSSKLSPVLEEHKRLTRPPECVRQEQQRFMARINGSRNNPERNVTLGDFAKNVWLPFIENRHAASTVFHNRYYWQRILEPRCGGSYCETLRPPPARRSLTRSRVRTRR